MKPPPSPPRAHANIFLIFLFYCLLTACNRNQRMVWKKPRPLSAARQHAPNITRICGLTNMYPILGSLRAPSRLTPIALYSVLFSVNLRLTGNLTPAVCIDCYFQDHLIFSQVTLISQTRGLEGRRKSGGPKQTNKRKLYRDTKRQNNRKT